MRNKNRRYLWVYFQTDQSVLSFSSLPPGSFRKPLRNILLISSLNNRFNRVVDTLIINPHLRIEDSFTLTTALALKISTPKDFKEIL